MRSAVWWLASCLTIAMVTPNVGRAATVTLYGEAGRFGSLGQPVSACGNQVSLPSCQTLSTVTVTDWQLDPGQSAYKSVVASDGTVFVGNLARSFSQFQPTATSTAITCFNPLAAVCFDEETATAKNFSTIRIPTANGFTYRLARPTFFAPHPLSNENQCFDTPPPVGVAGGDISDLQVVTDPILGERVLLVSENGSLERSLPDVYPAFGALSKATGAWKLDPSSTLNAIQIQQSNATVGPLACPNRPTGCTFSPACGPQGTCQSGLCVCTQNSQCPDGDSCIGGVCGTPSCQGPNDLAQLPQSKGIVQSLFFSEGRGGVVVTDNTGEPLAYAESPGMCDACCNYDGVSCPVACANPPCCTVNGCNTCPRMLFPRDVTVDPTSPLGDERFIMLYEYGDSRAEAVQEFRYDNDPPAIVPVSAPIFVETPPTCSASHDKNSSAHHWVKPLYDDLGNLWVQRSLRYAGGPFGVYLKNAASGQRKLETSCSYIDPATSLPRPFGFVCKPDRDLGGTITDPTITSSLPGKGPWGSDMLATTSGVILAVALGQSEHGAVLPIERHSISNGELAFTFRLPIDLASSQLGMNPQDTSHNTLAVMDTARNELWATVGLTEGPFCDTSLPGCSTSCPSECLRYEACNESTTWLYRLDVDEALAFGPRVLSVTAPGSVQVGATVPVEIGTNLACQSSSNCKGALKTQWSSLRGYLNGSAKPPVSWNWQCVANKCRYSATLPSSATNVAGAVEWHGIFFSDGSHSTDPSMLHTVGRTRIGS